MRPRWTRCGCIGSRRCGHTGYVTAWGNEIRVQRQKGCVDQYARAKPGRDLWNDLPPPKKARRGIGLKLIPARSWRFPACVPFSNSECLPWRCEFKETVTRIWAPRTRRGKLAHRMSFRAMPESRPAFSTSISYYISPTYISSHVYVCTSILCDRKTVVEKSVIMVHTDNPDTAWQLNG